MRYLTVRRKDIFCYIAPRYGLTLEEWNPLTGITYISCSADSRK